MPRWVTGILCWWSALKPARTSARLPMLRPTRLRPTLLLPSLLLPTLLLPVALSLTLAALGGCGGGGGDSGSSSTAASSTSSTAGSTSGDSAPAISTQPQSLSVAEGASAGFSVVASGSGTLSYQWRKNGSAISGATGASLSLASVGTADAGSYDVVVANSAGSVTSSSATLSVTTASGLTTPAISSQPLSQTAALGGSASFSVVASGSGTLAYQWFKDGSAISGATAASHAIASVAAGDAGSYRVSVSNSAGSVSSSTATLTVTGSASAGGSQAAAATSAAQAFLATLSSSQQATLQPGWSLATARRWSNLPAAMVSRNGLSWGSLSSSQQAAARTLISTALGSTGNTLHLGLQAADDYLYASGGGSSYGAGQYYIAMLGTPSASGFWLLQLTGHHLTYNIAFNGGYRSPTPLFLGVEPKASFTLSGSTWDPMAAQRQAMSDLGAALTGYTGAKLAGTYSDLLFGANGSGNIDGSCPRSYSSVTEHGLAYTSLSSAHQALVQAAIQAYVNTQATEYADELLASYLSAGALAQTWVAYSGSGTVSANGNYFRIEGPRLWIEFSVQRGVIFGSDIHYHTIWRDKSADYGGQCLG